MNWIDTIYLLCATIGGTILIIQTILIVLGAGGDADADIDPGDLHDGHLDAGHAHAGDDPHAADSFLKLLSFKTLVAFVTFFGLGGLASTQGGAGKIPSLLVAAGAGAVALYLVAYLMSVLSRLQSKGNIDLRNAVGETAKVYLSVPGDRRGMGKVTVAVQGRKIECKAVTPGPDIPTGAEVRVVAVNTSDTLEVLPVGKE